MIQPHTNPVLFCLAVNGVFDLVWDEEVETSEIVDAMENVFWSLEAVMAAGVPFSCWLHRRLMAEINIIRSSAVHYNFVCLCGHSC